MRKGPNTTRASSRILRCMISRSNKIVGVCERMEGIPGGDTVQHVETLQGAVMAIVVRDITERKRAEEALIEERHLLHTLMDNLPDLIYFKDRESRFTRINLALAKVYWAERSCRSGRQDRLRLLRRRTRQRGLRG